MTKLIIVPASPALVAELSPADASSARLRAAIRDLAVSGPIDIVSSRAARWHTSVPGCLQAWGAPQVKVGGGEYLPELVVRYLFPETQVVEARGDIGTLARTTVLALDGSAGLSSRAPLSLIEGGAWAHEWCQRLLRAHYPASQRHPERCGFDAQRLRTCGVIEPELWGQLAGIDPVSATLIAADDTLGVGRYVAVWEV